MLRQALSSSSRALRAAPRFGAAAPAVRPQFQSAAPAWSIKVAQPAAARWYSDAKEEKPAEEAKDGAKEPDAMAEMKKNLEAKEAEARDWKDKCLRSVADFRNLQDRTQREVKTAREFAISKFAKDLVESVDNLDRALGTVPQDKLKVENKSEDLQDLANFYEGLKMTETILMQTLQKHGLERMDPVGDKFNPNEHEATFMTPQPDKENNVIFHVQQKGFKLNGRVLRAAKVGVVKNN